MNEYEFGKLFSLNMHFFTYKMSGLNWRLCGAFPLSVSLSELLQGSQKEWPHIFQDVVDKSILSMVWDLRDPNSISLRPLLSSPSHPSLSGWSLVSTVLSCPQHFFLLLFSGSITWLKWNSKKKTTWFQIRTDNNLNEDTNLYYF